MKSIADIIHHTELFLRIQNSNGWTIYYESYNGWYSRKVDSKGIELEFKKKFWRVR